MASKKNTRFCGNKTRPQEDGYFCGIMFDPVATGERISSLRRARNLSREKLVAALDQAHLLRVSVTTMGKWERGQVKKMEAEQLKALQLFFHCSYDELVVFRYRETEGGRDPLFFCRFGRASSDARLFYFRSAANAPAKSATAGCWIFRPGHRIIESSNDKTAYGGIFDETPFPNIPEVLRMKSTESSLIRTVLDRLGIAYHAFPGCGEFLFCKTAAGLTFDLEYAEPGTLRLWRFVGTAPAAMAGEKYEYRPLCLPHASIGIEITDENDVCFYAERRIDLGRADGAELATRMIRQYTSIASGWKPELR